MKKLKLIVPILSFVGFACAGCAGQLLTPQTSTQAVVTPVQTTAPVITSVQQGTNIVTVTNQVTTTTYQTNYVTVTNGYTVSAGTTSTLATISAVNTATGGFDPFSGWVTLALGLATAGLGYYAKVKTAQAQTHASAASTIITAIEGLADPTAAAVKAAVAAKSSQMGTSAAVNSVVSAVTANL